MEAGREDDLALVMSGGGARGAYQVGFLRRLAREVPALATPVLTGVSAGAINAAFLANTEGDFEERCERLRDLWSRLRVEDVFRTQASSLLPTVLRWGLRLVTGGHKGAGELRSLVDTTPLRELLARELGAVDGRLTGIERNLQAGVLRAVALTCASYTSGASVTWVEGCELPMWQRAHRQSACAELTVDHVLASASLPLFFPAVRIAGAGAIGSGWYGDGGMRLTAPFSPAIHLGARRILAISTRHQAAAEGATAVPVPLDYPPPAQVLGMLLNAIFLDQVEADALRLERINELLAALPGPHSDMRPIELLVLRPSRDLGELANDYEARLPHTFRFLMRGLGTQRTRSNDLLSLVMFQEDYVGALLALGEHDAEQQLDRLTSFLEPGE